jgi:hypothetical protein
MAGNILYAKNTLKTYATAEIITITDIFHFLFFIEKNKMKNNSNKGAITSINPNSIDMHETMGIIKTHKIE